MKRTIVLLIIFLPLASINAVDNISLLKYVFMRYASADKMTMIYSIALIRGEQKEKSQVLVKKNKDKIYSKYEYYENFSGKDFSVIVNSSENEIMYTRLLGKATSRIDLSISKSLLNEVSNEMDITFKSPENKVGSKIKGDTLIVSIIDSLKGRNISYYISKSKKEFLKIETEDFNNSPSIFSVVEFAKSDFKPQFQKSEFDPFFSILSNREHPILGEKYQHYTLTLKNITE